MARILVLSPHNVMLTRKCGLFTIEAWDDDETFVIPLDEERADYLRRGLAETVDTEEAAIAIEGPDGPYMEHQGTLRYGII
ncbi:MAG TPA: hypothetical protein VGH82_05500 [Gaiellaceae bacterium]